MSKMIDRRHLLLTAAGMGGMLCVNSCQLSAEQGDSQWTRPDEPMEADTTIDAMISLPTPSLSSSVALEEALAFRRSVRAFSAETLALADLAQLLWAAQGITDPGGYRTTPSAGGLYPLELYVAAGNVEQLQAGIYHYLPHQHALEYRASGDRRTLLSEAALGQAWVADGAAVIAIAADYARTTGKYGNRGNQYVHMEVGAAGQSIYLQAQASGLATVFVGAFNDDDVGSILDLGQDEQLLALMPVGSPVATVQD